MDKFVSKPVVLDAVFFGKVEDIQDLPGVEIKYDEGSNGAVFGSFLTIQGVRTIIRPGEWLALENGTSSKYYPIKNDVFLARWKPLVV